MILSLILIIQFLAWIKTPKNTKNIFETKNVFFVQNKDFSFEICNYIIATIVLFEIINHNVDGE